MIYDLTQTLNEDLPVYPGDPHLKLQPAGVIAKDGFADHVLTIGTHNGTHMDAPAHMLEGGKQLKDYPAERFITTAVCVDVSDGFNAEKIRQKITSSVAAVLFYTGASRYFTQERYWQDYIVPDDATAQILIDKQILLAGIDTGSFDNQDGFPVHKALLGADILLVENLTNLEPLVGKIFELYALPLKLEKDGAPARVIAKLL